MASSKVVKRKRRGSHCVLLFDNIINKSSKLFSHVHCADQSALKLLDLLCNCQRRWSSLADHLRSRCKVLETEVARLRRLQEETAEMLKSEVENRRRAERARDLLRKKIDAIREVLLTNDVDEAKRRLENMNLSAMTNRSFNITRLDHSAGSLLDPLNVSIESHGDDPYNIETQPSRSHRPSSAGHAMDAINRPIRRSMRLAKFRSSSVPKFSTVNPAANTVPVAREMPESSSKDAVRVSRKRNSDKSDDSYFGVDVKRSVFTLPGHAYPTSERNAVPSTVSEESATPSRSVLTPKPATLSRLNRPHNFVSRSVLRMEVCSACGRRITFGKTAYKCAVCRLLVHPTCRKQLSQTCVPPNVLRTPMSSVNHTTALATSPRLTSAIVPHGLAPALPFGNSKLKGQANGCPAATPASPTLSMRLGLRNINLTDFCPADQFPRIPALVIHCVTEVVARGMNTVGIYRVSGSEKQVRDLYDKFFRSKMTPGLALVDDIHVVCGCLKLFLRNLSEPLVTFEQRPILAAASDRARTDPEGAVQEVLEVLESLPAPNRDTLSYVVMHLKMVARTSACQMGEDNLAKVFGPTLVGYSCPEPQLMQTVTETRTQQAVVKLLFSVPDHVYSEILSNPPPVDENSETEQDQQTTYFSPISVRANTVGTATPMQLRQTPHRQAALGLSSRKRFLPNFLSSHRSANDSSS